MKSRGQQRDDRRDEEVEPHHRRRPVYGLQ